MTMVSIHPVNTDEGDYWWEVLEEMYRVTLAQGDFRMGYKAPHQMQASPKVMDLLVHHEKWASRIGTRTPNPDVRVMGLFMPVVVMHPSDPARIYSDRQNVKPQANGGVDYHHLALWVQRNNGRFVYIDWDGNREDMR